MKRRYRNSSGQSVVEAVVVIGIVILLVTGLIAGTTSSLKATQSSRARSKAVKYAQEGLELARTLRDQGWATFEAKVGTWCIGQDNVWPVTPSASCASNITDQENNVFTRGVTITPDAPNQRVVVVADVSWIEGSQTRTTQLKTYFTRWR